MLVRGRLTGNVEKWGEANITWALLSQQGRQPPSKQKGMAPTCGALYALGTRWS